MQKKRQLVTILMLVVLAVFSLKGLFAGLIPHGSCDEFGHIHIHKQNKIASNVKLVMRPLSEHSDDDENDCHEGKSVFAYSPYPASVVDFKIPSFEVIFALVFAVENRFESPNLEPHRKPPKHS